MIDREYDVIVIGSGMGSLTVSSLLAQLRGKRVLVLERHFKPGGFTHDFRRGRWRWDVGIHYVGEMQQDGQHRRLLDLITGGKVDWSRVPEPYDRFLYPEHAFDAFRGARRLTSDLQRLFPAERRAIQQYVKDVENAATGFGLHVMRQNGSALLRGVGRVMGWVHPHPKRGTTRAYLDEHFHSPALKGILASQWGDYGLPPRLSAFAAHAMIVHHYLDGAWYPVGGAGRIAAGVRGIVEEAGGRVLVNRDVRRILVEGGRAIGVEAHVLGAGRTEAVERWHAPVVVSGAGAAITWERLVPEDVEVPFRKDLRRFVERHPPATNVTLFLGLSKDPREAGFSGGNVWMYRAYDHDAAYERRGSWIEEGDCPFAYLSFPSARDPQAAAHTAEVISLADYETFRPWREEAWRRRGKDYGALKSRAATAMLDLVERYHPGFRALIEVQEVATPLTNEHFTGHPRGGMYGLSCVPERFGAEVSQWTKARTSIPGLYLTGVDTVLLGLGGAVMGGLTTLSHLPDGISFPQAFRAAAH